MTDYSSELTHIRRLLENNPRGLTITEIANQINVNRNSVAKYLDVMRTSGEVEQRAVGRAKLYFISKRIPLANLLDYSSDIICVLDDDLVITQINRNFSEFFEVDQAEIIGNKLSTILDRGSYDKISELLDHDDNPPIDQIEFNDFYFKPKVIPTVFLDGSSGVTVILGDITKETKTISALTESEDRFHTFVRASTSGLVLTDSELKVIEINDAALQLTGLSRLNVVGKHILDFLPDTEASGRYTSYQEIMNKEKPQTTNEVVFPSSLGGKRVIVSVFSAGAGLGMIVTDISDLA